MKVTEATKIARNHLKAKRKYKGLSDLFFYESSNGQWVTTRKPLTVSSALTAEEFLYLKGSFANN